MSTSLKTGRYDAALGTELEANASADGRGPRTLFRRRGRIELRADVLVLSDWTAAGDLLLTRGDILATRREFDELYPRFMGGGFDACKPLILTTRPVDLYLLIDRKGLVELTRNREWQLSIEAWHEGQL